MKRVTIAVLVLGLGACYQAKGTPVPVKGAVDTFAVEKLFTVDNCTVYRFEDEGHNRYFADCGGKAASINSCHSHQNGKTQTTHCE